MIVEFPPHDQNQRHVHVRDALQGSALTAVELFCGAGGMSFGLKGAGIDVIAAYDAWAVAIKNYQQNMPGSSGRQFDLKDLLSIIPEITALRPAMICGGPPCQDFSAAGSRKEGKNAKMTLAFAIIIAAVRPEWFLMENVTRAATSQAWMEAKALLKGAGYGISESKVDASHYGVPQKRRRLIVVGRLGERDGFLQSAVAAAASPRPMTLRDNFGPQVSNLVYFPPRMSHKQAVWEADGPAPTIRSASARPLPAKYRSRDDQALIENGFVYSQPMRAGRGVRTVDQPLATITRTSCERATPRYLNDPHPADPVPAMQTHTLTRDQISQVQGFPVWWKWVGTKRDVMQMIANAVPSPLAKRIGEVILARHRGDTGPAIEGRFVDWLVRKGRTRASARNVKSSLARARRLLGGRTFQAVHLEMAALEANPEFGKLAKAVKSDLRQALKRYDEFLSSKAENRTRAKKSAPNAAPSVDKAA